MIQNSSQSRNPQAPVAEFRAGAVKAAIWQQEVEREGRRSIQHSTKITRSYRDKQGNWQEVSSYFPQDLPKLILVAQKAYEFAILRESETERDDLPV